MRKHKIIKIIILLLIVIILPVVSKVQTQAVSRQIFITVKINGHIINMDSLPYIKDQRTMVPIRFVAESLNADVEWFGKEKKAVIKDTDKVIELVIGSNKITVNGEEKIMDTTVELVNGRTMVPIRFVAENMDCTVKWDGLTYTALISRENAVVPASCISNRSYTDEDIIWLARIVDVEARGLSMEARLAVANVVLNRRDSSKFPGTIYGVIFDKEYTVQFPPAHKDGFRELVPTSDSVIAAKMALEGINNISSSLYFNNAPFKGKEKDLYKIIDGEYFYY